MRVWTKMSNAVSDGVDGDCCARLPQMAKVERDENCASAADNGIDNVHGCAAVSPSHVDDENRHVDMKSDDLDKLSSMDSALISNDKDKLVREAIKEFHSKRYLTMKNVPTNATEEDIRKAFEEHLEIKEIVVNRVSQTAKITLMKPEVLDYWPSTELQYTVHDQMTNVRLSETEGVLCVAHLPFIYTEEDFRNLVQMYGPVASCFLCRSEKTGEHKGYGFVEYSSREVAYKAKPLLEQKTLGDCQIKCCWLEQSHVTYSSLHSKCLFVDHLPNGYRDMVEFRKIFSTVCSPSYCQIGMKNGQALGFGLVEFDNADDAEESQRLLNHSKLGDHQIRVTYCAPGCRAMVIYNKLTSGLAMSVKQPLLPDPPRNPDISRMVSMQNNTPLYQNQRNGIGSRNWENGHRATNGSFNDSQQHPISSAPSNSSLQEAVILLLAAQVQSQLGMQQASLLNNPQSLSLMLQAAFGQQANASESQDVSETLRNVLHLLQQQANGQNRCHVANGNAVNNGNNCQWHPPKTVDGKAYNKVPLLPDPPCVKQMDSGGLLPTPPISKMHSNAFCSGQGNFMNSALHNGNQQQSCFVKTQPEIISKTPYESQGRQKVPLLGDKPPNVPLSGQNAIGVMDRVGFSLLNPPNSNGTSDPNAIAQLLAPLILKQNQLLQGAKLSKVNENVVFQQPKNGNSIQSAPPAIVNLLLQSIHRLQQQQGELNKAGVLTNQNGFQFPLNVSYPSPNLFLGASTLPQKQLLFGSSPLVSPPPPPPQPAAGPRPSSHVLTMAPPGTAKQAVFTQPFLFPSQSQNGLQAGPLAAAQLMAEIQQRGSLLGDFWQATQTLGGAHLASHIVNGKMAAPLIGNVGYHGLAKRKMAFAPEIDLSGDPAEQLKKRRT